MAWGEFRCGMITYVVPRPLVALVIAMELGLDGGPLFCKAKTQGLLFEQRPRDVYA
jgi:hypothetical protein